MHTEIASLREIHDRLNGAVDPAPTQRPMNRNGASIHLPKPRTLDSPFTALVHARRSRYDFDPSGELSVDSVGTLLGTALGLGRRIEAGDGVVRHHQSRDVPDDRPVFGLDDGP